MSKTKKSNLMISNKNFDNAKIGDLIWDNVYKEYGLILDIIGPDGLQIWAFWSTLQNSVWIDRFNNDGSYELFSL